MAAKLGAILLRLGLVSEDQLEEALQAQIMFGGRLGTNLIELGFITDEKLAEVLGRQFQIPSCRSDDFKNIPLAVLALASKELAAKHQIIPLRATEREVWVAMIDPGNLAAIDELAFVLRKRVNPLIAPES